MNKLELLESCRCLQRNQVGFPSGIILLVKARASRVTCLFTLKKRLHHEKWEVKQDIFFASIEMIKRPSTDNLGATVGCLRLRPCQIWTMADRTVLSQLRQRQSSDVILSLNMVKLFRTHKGQEIVFSCNLKLRNRKRGVYQSWS